MRRDPRILCWILPLVFCLILYWPGLFAWFQQDDFAWLNLAQDLREGRSLWSAMFRPLQGQGSLRPLSERAYYLGLPALFGLNPFPFRLLAFLAHFGSLLLVIALVRRLSGSLVAGALAAILWTANSKLFVVMSWSAEFMLILCGTLLLLALNLFIKHIDTGEKKYLAGCWAAFLIGFGVLETNTVFPLLAAGYALVFARRHLWKTIPMFAASALYAVIHMLVAPKASTGPYALIIDGRLPLTLWKYWQWAFIPEGLSTFTVFSERAGPLIAWLFTAALLGYALWQARSGRWVPVCYLGWFVVTVLPVLPVPQHLTDYYLTLPVLGIAMAGADAIWTAWQRGWGSRALALGLTALFLYTQVPAARGGVEWWHNRSHRGRAWLNSLKTVCARHPGKVILIDGINDDLFWNAMAHNAPRAAGMLHVYLAPGADAAVTPHPELADVRTFVYPREKFIERFRRGEVEVYKVNGTGLVRSTGEFRSTKAPALMEPVWWMEAADPWEDWRLGQGWHRNEGHYRWTARRAVVQVPGPQRSGQRFWIQVYASTERMARGPVKLAAYFDGVAIGKWELNRPGDFEFEAPLGDRWTGRESVALAIETDPPFTLPNDTREFGVIVGRLGIR